MCFLPPLRRLLLPSLVCLAIILAYRSSHAIDKSYLSSLLIEQPIIHYPNRSIKVENITSKNLLFQNPEGNHITPPAYLYYDYVYDNTEDDSLRTEDEPVDSNKYIAPSANRFLHPLLDCRIEPNRFTSHIRLPVHIRSISMVVTGETENEKRQFLNAAPMSLPYWSNHQYLLVTRVQTDGSSQMNIVCEANICYTDESKKRPGEQPCSEEDLELLGGAEGMRCATPPLTINVPPTPAKKCGNDTTSLTDIPGFHDPRIFWSGRGEPLMMMNTQSQYACFGLWVIDLRKVHQPLGNLLGANPKLPTLGPLMSYPSLTEITRNPPETRGVIEKNWMFFSNEHSTYVHYDMSPSIRTFAQLLGGGITTPNLTDPYEVPCLADGAKPKEYEVWGGSWHQGTNSLKLILCERSDGSCRQKPENTVFFSLVHHKHKNVYSLPLRYERYFAVWSSTPPFQMLATSKYPILLANESASGWDAAESWDDDEEHRKMVAEGGKGKGDFAVFTYTPTIAYAWGRDGDQPQDKNLGYLDDEVILGIGIDDMEQGYARAKVSDLLQCMRTCPGRAREPLNMPSGSAAVQKEDKAQGETDNVGTAKKKEEGEHRKDEQQEEKVQEKEKEKPKEEVQKKKEKEEAKKGEQNQKKEQKEKSKPPDKQNGKANGKYGNPGEKQTKAKQAGKEESSGAKAKHAEEKVEKGKKKATDKEVEPAEGKGDAKQEDEERKKDEGAGGNSDGGDGAEHEKPSAAAPAAMPPEPVAKEQPPPAA